MINWTDFMYDMGYVVVAFFGIYVTGWLIYDKIATKGYSLSKAIFEERNMAAGLEITAFLFMEVLIAMSAMSGSAVTEMAENGAMVVNYERDIEAVLVTIVFSNITFFLFRGIGSAVIKALYKGKLDNHGEEVEFNNEIFAQKNMGASMFSVTYLLIMYFMIVQEDFLNTSGYQIPAFFNMGAVLLTGILVYFLYNILFMKKGHTTLDELFIDNNLGVGLSITGFMFGVLFLQNKLMATLGDSENFFNSELDTYIYFVMSFVFLFVFRKLFTIVLGIATKRNFQNEFLVEDNPVVGLLDMAFIISSTLLFSVVI